MKARAALVRNASFAGVLSVEEILDALRRAPELWPSLRETLLHWLDGLIALAPESLRPGFQAARDAIAAAVEAPIDLVDQLLVALKDAIASGNWGPATHSDSDIA